MILVHLRGLIMSVILAETWFGVRGPVRLVCPLPKLCQIFTRRSLPVNSPSRVMRSSSVSGGA